MTAGIDFSLDDTIAALCSPAGSALRGVIRVSGPETAEVLGSLFVPDDVGAWSCSRFPWRHTGRVQLATDVALSVAVLLWPSKRSYTGQPAAEVHLPGSPPLVEGVLASLFEAGVRPARAGEFTLRAFLAGRMDLLQAEAVLGVIEADDDVRLRAALSQLAGGISGRISELHEQLLLDLADLEAGLDFVEEDIKFIDRSEFTGRLETACGLLTRLLEQAADRMESRARLRVVLAGPPNAGKSTLFNALIGSAAALVSPVAGTTRDYLWAEVCWGGRTIELVDTAGCAEGDGDLMQSAHAHRDRELQEADVILWCTPADAPGRDRAAGDVRSRLPAGPLLIPIVTKSDLAAGTEGAVLRVSAHTGAGFDALCDAVLDRLERASPAQELIGSSAARCRDSLLQARSALDIARQLAVSGSGDELIAAQVRAALDHTGRIAGRVYTDDILDRIFSRFCIGK